MILFSVDPIRGRLLDDDLATISQTFIERMAVESLFVSYVVIDNIEIIHVSQVLSGISYDYADELRHLIEVVDHDLTIDGYSIAQVKCAGDQICFTFSSSIVGKPLISHIDRQETLQSLSQSVDRLSYGLYALDMHKMIEGHTLLR